MSELARSIPGLYWVAFVFLALALWSEDPFGIYIGAACMVVGTLQVLRRGSDGGDGGQDADRVGDHPR